MKAIILAAGVGRRLGQKTKKFPKCLIPITRKGEGLLPRYLNSFRSLGLKNVVVVCGHRRNKIKRECRKNGRHLHIQFVFNRDYKKGSILSLYRASRHLNEDCLLMDADVYFPTPALKKLIESKHPTAFLLDRRSKSSGEEMMVMAKNGRPALISKKVDPKLKVLGEATGFFKIKKAHAGLLRSILKSFVSGKKTHLEYEEAYNGLMKKVKVGYEGIGRLFWTEMDFEEDLKKIRAHAGWKS